MKQLFETDPELPHGFWVLRDFIEKREQLELVSISRELLKTHPLVHPKTKQGYDLSLKVSSWGEVGWFGDGERYSYIPKHPVNQQPWPQIPTLIRAVMMQAHEATIEEELAGKVHSFDEFRLDTVLLNWYPSHAKLGSHQDNTEEDLESPIITISLGDSCVFNIGTENRADKGIDLKLHSGDVVVMGLGSRLAYHGVKQIITGSCLDNILSGYGRISLTGRKVFR